MGKGDKKTTKGKRFKGSYGVSRKRKSGIKAYVPKKSAKPKKEEATAEAVEVDTVQSGEAVTEAPAKKTAAKKKAPAKKPAAKKAAPKKKAAKK